MQAPAMIGRYTVRRLLGTGGFAVVWLAEDERLQDKVAIKVLAENWSHRLDLRDRFEQEARVLRRTKSHRVVEVYDIDELPDGRPYFVMTFADLGSLADRLELGPLPVAQALRHGADIARGVDDLHGAGVVHRDVKPSNVLFRSAMRDAEPALLIADLGLARELSRGSRFTLPAGSPGYMAPEQADPEYLIDERTDIYGIGATVYHALTGYRPAEPPEAPSVLRPGLPPGTDEVVLRAMALDPGERWASAGELAGALEELAAVAAPGMAPLQPVIHPAPASRRSRRSILLAALAAVLALAAVAATQFGLPRSKTNAPTGSVTQAGPTQPPNAPTGSVTRPGPTQPPNTPTRSVTQTGPTQPPNTPTGSPAGPAQPPPGLVNCNHGQGTGQYISADYVETTASPPSKIGSVQLCRDSSQRYWAYIVLYSPLPAGQWANAELERWADGHYDARFTCAATVQGGNGPVTEGRRECWSPKVTGTDKKYTFVASPQVCLGAYGDTSSCYVQGHTARTR